MIFSISVVSFDIHGKTIDHNRCRPLKFAKQANIHTFMTVSMVFEGGNSLKNPPVEGVGEIPATVNHGMSQDNCGSRSVMNTKWTSFGEMSLCVL